MNKFFYVASAMAFLLAFNACDDDDDNTYTRTDSNSTSISATTIEANRFVYEIMSDYYLWYKYMPTLNYKTQSDTEEYFESLLYSGDRFSFILDDADSYFDSEEGISTEKGWDYILMRYDSSSDQVIAVINYVYANTPAANAGVKRGDIIQIFPSVKFYAHKDIVLKAFYKLNLTAKTPCVVGIFDNIRDKIKVFRRLVMLSF